VTIIYEKKCIYIIPNNIIKRQNLYLNFDRTILVLGPLPTSRRRARGLLVERQRPARAGVRPGEVASTGTIGQRACASSVLNARASEEKAARVQ
jgi:hypothetical protein